MIDVVSKRCPGQEGLCSTTGNRMYRGYCTYCFQYEFPDDPLSIGIRKKTKETQVRQFLDEHFPKMFIHDKQLSTHINCDCTVRRRPDHRCLIDGTMLCIETDENQHKSYSEMDEEARYNDLTMSFTGKWVYIRYNPDRYRDKDGRSNDTGIQTRLKALKREVAYQIDRIRKDKNTELLERVYMFYDGDDGQSTRSFE